MSESEPITESGVPGTGLGGEERVSTQLSLEALYDFSSTVNASLELDVVLRRALDQVLALFGFPSGTIRVLDPPTGELHLMAAAGLGPELGNELVESLRVGEAPAGLAAQRRALVVIEDPDAAAIRSRSGRATAIVPSSRFRCSLAGCCSAA
jgi:hypothetical protein